MRLLLSTALFLLFALSLSAQPKSDRYIDVVYRHNAPPLEGTVISYEYNQRVVLVLRDGAVKELPWEEVKRVNFKYDKRYSFSRSEEVTEVVTEQEPVLPAPNRMFRHQVTSSLNFGRVTNNSNGFFRSSTAIGAGLAYHLLYDLSRVTIGAGLDVNLMNHQRQENVIATTLLVDLPIGKGRWRPFARMESGPTFPFGSGNADENITNRSLTLLYHPALGVEITPRNGSWGKMTIDIGYRFLNSRFELTTASLDVVERNVNYRRLTFRGGMRF